MTPAWIAVALTAAGIAALAVFAPMAKAVENESAPIDKPGWSLWACLPGRGPGGCVLMARPGGETACKLAMAELVAEVPPGTRLACAHVQQVEQTR